MRKRAKNAWAEIKKKLEIKFEISRSSLVSRSKNYTSKFIIFHLKNVNNIWKRTVSYLFFSPRTRK